MRYNVSISASPFSRRMTEVPLTKIQELIRLLALLDLRGASDAPETGSLLDPLDLGIEYVAVGERHMILSRVEY